MNYNWCHSPKCHTYKTQDRVRGTKGSKVLRTRKIKQEIDRAWYHRDQVYNYFCSQGCLMDFMRAHIQRIVALAPRTEPLETPIDDPTKIKHTTRAFKDTAPSPCACTHRSCAHRSSATLSGDSGPTFCQLCYNSNSPLFNHQFACCRCVCAWHSASSVAGI